MAINLCTICLGIDKNMTNEFGQLISINCHFHDFCNWKIFNKNLFPKTATTVSLKMSAEKVSTLTVSLVWLLQMGLNVVSYWNINPIKPGIFFTN